MCYLLGRTTSTITCKRFALLVLPTSFGLARSVVGGERGTERRSAHAQFDTKYIRYELAPDVQHIY